MTSVSTEFLRFRYRTCCAVRLTGISKRTCIFDSPSSFKIHACARSVLSGTPAHVYTRIRFYDGYYTTRRHCFPHFYVTPLPLDPRDRHARTQPRAAPQAAQAAVVACKSKVTHEQLMRAANLYVAPNPKGVGSGRLAGQVGSPWVPLRW